jgi:2-phosphosulfolactate phosphatase
LRATPATPPRPVAMAVIIDVLRAFTTACHAFQAGVESMLVCLTVGEAFELRKRFPAALLMGEVNGIPIPEFDLPNSPTALEKLKLGGKQIILRTTAGSRFLLAWKEATLLAGMSLCNLTATMNWITMNAPSELAIVASGEFPDGWGDEDVACGDLLEAQLNGSNPDINPFLERVKSSMSADHYTDPGSKIFPPHDLELATQVDRFDFAMPVAREGDLLVMRRESQPILKKNRRL